MNENNVKIVFGFSEEEGAEDFKIKPKLHCNHFLEVWHLFCW